MVDYKQYAQMQDAVKEDEALLHSLAGTKALSVAIYTYNGYIYASWLFPLPYEDVRVNIPLEVEGDVVEALVKAYKERVKTIEEIGYVY